jgi:hypothetical protein
MSSINLLLQGLSSSVKMAIRHHTFGTLINCGNLQGDCAVNWGNTQVYNINLYGIERNSGIAHI